MVRAGEHDQARAPRQRLGRVSGEERDGLDQPAELLFAVERAEREPQHVLGRRRAEDREDARAELVGGRLRGPAGDPEETMPVREPPGVRRSRRGSRPAPRACRRQARRPLVDPRQADVHLQPADGSGEAEHGAARQGVRAGRHRPGRRIRARGRGRSTARRSPPAPAASAGRRAPRTPRRAGGRRSAGPLPTSRHPGPAGRRAQPRRDRLSIEASAPVAGSTCSRSPQVPLRRPARPASASASCTPCVRRMSSGSPPTSAARTPRASSMRWTRSSARSTPARPVRRSQPSASSMARAVSAGSGPAVSVSR